MWLSSSCECSHLKFQPITWLLLLDQIMADLEEAFNLVASKFGIQALNSHQQLAISKLIERKKDIFINFADWLRKISDFSSFAVSHRPRIKSARPHLCCCVAFAHSSG